MTSFKRELAPKIIDQLKVAPLFVKKLKADCEKGEVFPAVRDGYMSFYYAGGSLFKYGANGFSTHIKYAFVPKGSDDCYVTQEKFGTELEPDFEKGYKKIKERCELYAGDEDTGVSNLYIFSPVSKKKEGNIFLVDIEVAFTAEKDDKIGKKRNTTDRIDILLYDNEERQLLFCEAKLFSNGETRADKGRTPAVVEQLDRYNDQIAKNEKRIREQYAKHFEVLHDLFGTNLNPPEKVYKHCGLLLFGFDNDQKKGRLEKHLPGLGEHKCYAKGEPNDLTAQTLYEYLTKVKQNKKK